MGEGVLAGSLDRVMVLEEGSQVPTIGSRIGPEPKSPELPPAYVVQLLISPQHYFVFVSIGV